MFENTALVGALLEFEVALARAQARLGMIPEEAAEAITRAAVIGNFDVDSIVRDARESASIAIPLIKALKARSGSEYVHWGSTSQDAIDTAIALLLDRAQEAMRIDHVRLEQSLKGLSEAHANTVMLGRTLMQPAAPITFGYKVAGWYGAVHRGWFRTWPAFRAAVRVQFGGAVGTLASYGNRGEELARAISRELHLPTANAPSHAHRDRLAALIATYGIYVGSLGKIARDLVLLMQHEVGEVSAPGGESSAMPHKRNPVGCVHALAAATRMPGLVATYLNAMVQEHERAAGGWQAEWQTMGDAVNATASALAGVTDTIGALTVHPERMRANLDALKGVIDTEKLGAVEELRQRLMEEDD
jgi:3-carboxy-cis,cis-muconate cycloisomerase